MRAVRGYFSLCRTAVAVTALIAMQSFAQAAEPLEIGAPIPLTGPYASDGKVMEQGIRLAVKHLNEKGGVDGRQVSVRIFDIGDLTPDKLQAAASELVDRHKVSVLINGYGGMGPDIPAFCPAKVPYLNNNATTQVVELTTKMGCTNIFMASDVDESYGKQSFAQLNKIGLKFPNKTIAVLHGPYDWELNNTAGIRAAAEAEGWKVVLNEEVQYGMNQWSGIFLKLRSAKPDLVVIETLDPSSVITFLDQFKKTPLQGSVVYAGYILSTTALTELVTKGSLDGVLGMTLSAQRANEKGELFEKAWKAEYNEAPPMSIAAQVYDEVMLWAAAATLAKDASAYENVNKQLETLAYEGLTGTIKFNAKRYVTASDETQPPLLLQAQKGSIQTLMIGSEKVSDFVEPGWLK